MNLIDFENFKEKLESMSSQDIRLLFGEMTAQEMRTTKAVLKWTARELKKIIWTCKELEKF